MARKKLDDRYTLRGPAAGPRRELPVQQAWDRLLAPPRRRDTLLQAFTPERLASGAVFYISGPTRAGKTQVALAVCDKLGYAAALAGRHADHVVLKPRGDLCVIIDPVSAQSAEDVHELLAFYAGTPMILIDRDPDVFVPFRRPEDPLIKLSLPSTDAISEYIASLLDGYPSALTHEDIRHWAGELTGLSLAEVNAVTVDAALLRMQHDQPVDSVALADALAAHQHLRPSPDKVPGNPS